MVDENNVIYGMALSMNTCNDIEVSFPGYPDTNVNESSAIFSADGNQLTIFANVDSYSVIDIIINIAKQ